MQLRRYKLKSQAPHTRMSGEVDSRREYTTKHRQEAKQR